MAEGTAVPSPSLQQCLPRTSKNPLLKLPGGVHKQCSLSCAPSPDSQPLNESTAQASRRGPRERLSHLGEVGQLARGRTRTPAGA